MAIKLPITATTDQRMGLIFFKLMQLSGIVNRTRETDIIVDLTEARFLHAIYLSGLFSLMRAWQYEGKNIIIESKHTGLSSYLKTICFEKGFVLDDKPNAIKYLESFRTKQYDQVTYYTND